MKNVRSKSPGEYGFLISSCLNLAVWRVVRVSPLLIALTFSKCNRFSYVLRVRGKLTGSRAVYMLYSNGNFAEQETNYGHSAVRIKNRVNGSVAIWLQCSIAIDVHHLVIETALLAGCGL